MVVDTLSKYGHFMALKHPYTAMEVAQVYLGYVFRLHGWPQSFVISQFKQALFTLQDTILLLSLAHHPQIDGQTEIVNKCVETFLRCICSESPKDRSMWLPLAEWWYNTNYHTSIQATPYEVVYNQPPPLYLPYLPISRRLQKEVLWLKVGFG